MLELLDEKVRLLSIRLNHASRLLRALGVLELDDIKLTCDVYGAKGHCLHCFQDAFSSIPPIAMCYDTTLQAIHYVIYDEEIPLTAA